MTHIIDGNAIAAKKREEIAQEIAENNLAPTLHIILANNLDASAIYVRRKIKACEEVGITPHLHKFDETCDQGEIISLIDTLNNDKTAHGIFMQLPAFDHIDDNVVVQSIHPDKDVDGLTHINMGRLVAGDKNGLVACTPQGVMEILAHEKIDLGGQHAVIVGRSLLFGKPMGQLLLQANCTVTQCHSHTRDLPSMTKQADILIVAVGQAEMVKADWIKHGATVIDVGISKNDDGDICGDVDFENVKNIARAITPVPGGVGPMTVANLLSNTVRAHIKK
jgi:methylenetetrahydrofolate dehydrogenase (NADP+)/methenyltetrahydrofolate cyclohydrolase